MDKEMKEMLKACELANYFFTEINGNYRGPDYSEAFRAVGTIVGTYGSGKAS